MAPPRRSARARADLPKVATLLRRILEESREAIVVGEASGAIHLVNRAAEELFGLREADVIGKLTFEALCPPGIWLDLRRRFLSSQFGGAGRLTPTETEILSGGGDRIPVDLSACAFGDPERPRWIAIFLLDLRQRLKLEERLAHAQRELEKGSRPILLAELAGTAAHELNQPLTSIMGYAEILRRRFADGSPNASAVDVIVQEAERMAELVRKIGRVNRYETKNYVGETRIVDLERAVDDAKTHD